MDDLPSRSPPAAWLQSIEAGRADLAARRPGVPAEIIIARLREREERLRDEAAAEPDRGGPLPPV